MRPELMRAVVTDRPGLAFVELATVPIPSPGAGEVLVRVEAAGLNPVDCKLAGGWHPDWRHPHVLGLDVCGIVESVGDGVANVTPGQRVANHCDLRRDGAFAEYAVIAADTLAVVPDAVEPEEAAALPCAGMTALQAVVDRLRVTGEDTLLITAGAGGVGGTAIQLAVRAGARVLATCSAGNADDVRRLGAEPIDYRRLDVATEVRRLTGGRGVDAVIDAVSSESASALLDLLVHAGALVSIAGTPDLSHVVPFTFAPSIHEIALGAAHSHGDARARRRLATGLAELLGLVAARQLDPRIVRVVPLEEVPGALRDLVHGHTPGKIVVSLGH